jgi:hypothetical protein
MDILIFNVYRTFRPLTKTNKQLLINLKNQHDFKICFILRFSFKLKMLKFFFRKNSSIIFVWQSFIVIKYGAESWSEGLGGTWVKGKSFLKEYLIFWSVTNKTNQTNKYKTIIDQSEVTKYQLSWDWAVPSTSYPAFSLAILPDSHPAKACLFLPCILSLICPKSLYLELHCLIGY